MAQHILVVDDDESIRHLIDDYLSENGYRVSQAHCGREMQAVLASDTVDLIVLDVKMPGEDGFTLARNVRQTSDVPIIMLTGQTHEVDRVLGLELGADDYLTKPFSPRELIARVKALLRRRAPEHAQEKLVAGTLVLDSLRHQVLADGAEIALGPTEFKLLQFFMAHQERVFSRMQLLDQVWGDHVFIEDRTVDVHILRLRKALQPFAVDGWVQTVRGAGYRFAAPSAG